MRLYGDACGQWRNVAVYLVDLEWVSAGGLDAQFQQGVITRDAKRDRDCELHRSSERCRQSHSNGNQVAEHYDCIRVLRLW